MPATKSQLSAPIESSLVNYLRRHPEMSRVKLAKSLNIAPSTVGIHVDDLVTRGFLKEGERIATRSGRHPTIVELNPDAGQFVGIDLDGQKIYGVSVDFAQQVLQDDTSAIRPKEHADEVVEHIGEVIKSVCDPDRPLLGIGIAVPGVVDLKSGMAIHYEHIRGWQNIPLVERLNESFGVPVHIENNIRSMAMAERVFGAGKTTDHYLCIGIRTGVGSGIMLNGQLYCGPNHMAGEIGHWLCPTLHEGQTRTLEDLVAIPSILNRLSELVHHNNDSTLPMRDGKVSLAVMMEAVNQNHPLVVSLLSEIASELGMVISQMTMMANPEKVIIGGPLVDTGDLFLVPLRESVQRYLPELHAHQPEVVLSQLGERGGALGAAALTVHHWQPTAS